MENCTTLKETTIKVIVHLNFFPFFNSLTPISLYLLQNDWTPLESRAWNDVNKKYKNTIL